MPQKSDFSEIYEFLNNSITGVHENAVKHGWWEEERKSSEIYSLVHSELSEALEEYRRSRPNCYVVGDYDEVIAFVPKEWWNGTVSSKPEGIAVELADYIIRVLDYFGYKEWSFEKAIAQNPIYICARDNSDLTLAIADAHYETSIAYWYSSFIMTEFEEKLYLSRAIDFILHWFDENDLDVIDIIKVKDDYNRRRPYRHGGKVI